MYDCMGMHIVRQPKHTISKSMIWQVINIGTEKLYPWGWRLSLGLAAVPATTLLLGGIFLDDTPNSLLERGHPEKVLSPPVFV